MISHDDKITLKNNQGVSLAIDPKSLNPGSDLQASLDCLLKGGGLGDIDEKARLALSKKRSLIGSGENALIVRFDLKVVRIDESLPLDLGRLTRDIQSPEG